MGSYKEGNYTYNPYQGLSTPLTKKLTKNPQVQPRDRREPAQQCEDKRFRQGLDRVVSLSIDVSAQDRGGFSCPFLLSFGVLMFLLHRLLPGSEKVRAFRPISGCLPIVTSKP